MPTINFNPGAKKPLADVGSGGLLVFVGGAATVLRLGQLGPDALPVVRAKVAACYGAIGGVLDLDAAFHRNWSFTLLPCVDSLGGNAEASRKIGGADKVACPFECFIHAFSIKHYFSESKH